MIDSFEIQDRASAVSWSRVNVWVLCSLSSKLIARASRCSLQSSSKIGKIGTRDISCWKRHVTNVLANEQPCVNHWGSQSHDERSRWVIATFGFAPANRDFARLLETLGLSFPTKYYKLTKDTALGTSDNANDVTLKYHISQFEELRQKTILCKKSRNFIRRKQYNFFSSISGYFTKSISSLLTAIINVVVDTRKCHPAHYTISIIQSKVLITCIQRSYFPILANQ